MTATRERQRRELITHIMRQLAHHPRPLPAVNDLGHQFIVTALGEEPARLLFERIRAAGGYANAFIQTRGRVVLVPFIKKEGALETGEETELSMPLDAESTVDMLLEYLCEHPEGTLLSIAGPQNRPAIATRPEAVPALA